MNVMNTTKKEIGIGGVALAPGKTMELPAGFGKDHPVVRFFIKRGYLTSVSGGGVLVPPGAKTDAPGGNNTLPQDPTPAQIRAMNSGNLAALAERLGVDISGARTNSARAELIIAAMESPPDDNNIPPQDETPDDNSGGENNGNENANE